MSHEWILVVEDESIVQLHLKKILERLGYQIVDVVSSAKDAVTAAQRRRPDLVLMDVRLNGRVDGIEAAQKLRDHFDIPVVFVTAYADAETLQRAKDAEPSGYIVKPFDERDIQAALTTALAKDRAVQKLKQHEQWLATILESLEHGVVVTDVSGKVTFLNHLAEKQTGWSNRKAAGKSISDIVIFDDDPPPVLLRQIIEETICHGVSNAFRDVTLVARDGSKTPVDGTAAPLGHKDTGAPDGVVLVFRDISSRKRAEAETARLSQELERSRQEPISILNEVGVGCAVVESDGTVSFVNGPASRILDGPPARLLARPWHLVIPVDDETKEQVGDAMRAPAATRRRITAHLGLRKPRWIEIDVRDHPRNPQQRLLVLYDHTELHDLRRLLDEKSHFHGLVGTSPAMQRVQQQIREVAPLDWTVLIEGETGTGKELVARAVHAESRRSGGPLVAVNTAGLNDSLLASQLFGHRRGAFTGAVADKKGVFEAADGGTLFLDEIGDIAASVQPSLLRVLEDKEITPVGDSAARTVDVRLIAATHCDLNRAVEEGRFRADLLYRIRVARIELPPLRERGTDIEMLTLWFLHRASAATGKIVTELSPLARERVASYSWPGNVRELKSAIEHGVIRAQGRVLEASDLPPELDPDASWDRSCGEEGERILAALREAKGNRTQAARLLGISRATFYRRMIELEIEPD